MLNIILQGTPCDDGNPITVDDTCDGYGLCEGFDPCEGVVCRPLTQCFAKGVCVNGVCTTPMLPDNTLCDDKRPDTYHSICVNGFCGGTLPCVDTCIAWQNKVDIKKILCFPALFSLDRLYKKNLIIDYAVKTLVGETTDFGLRSLSDREGWLAAASSVERIDHVL